MFSLSRLRNAARKMGRPSGAWLGFSGLYLMAGGPCPCCGNLGCPNGVVGAGIVGGLVTTVLFLWRRIVR